jgi:hypothetical protein
MKTWQKLSLIVLPALLIAAIGIWRINVARNRPAVVPHQAQERHLSDEEMVQPRKLYIDDLKSAKDLIGKPVWIQAGYELDYYPFAAHQVNFAHKAGVLPSVQRLDIRDIVTEKIPPGVPSRIPRGTSQDFAVFTMPGDEKNMQLPSAQIRVPILPGTAITSCTTTIRTRCTTSGLRTFGRRSTSISRNRA